MILVTMKAIILAGGYGSRFWPKSRKNRPKQCLPIASDKPMIVDTVDRLKPIVDEFYISTGKELEKPLRDLLRDVKYVIEPLAKNTAAAIGLSCITVSEDEVIVVETADHTYSDPKSYLDNLKEAAKMAKKGKIVLIGIKPSFAHTGFGYIKQGKLIKKGKIEIYEIEEFKEKPSLEIAKEYLKDGNYLWNAGIFICKAGVMLKAIEKYMPQLYSALIKIKQSNFDQSILKKEFEKLKSISIDYGIMEKANNTAMIRGEFPWDDVGDWKAAERIHKKDDNGNIVLGKHKGSAINSIIIGENVKTEGVKELIIVDTNDCLLVCNKNRSQDVKKIVEELEKDPKLKKFVEREERPEQHNVFIDSDNIETKSDALIATIGVSNLYIEKDQKVKVIKKSDKK